MRCRLCLNLSWQPLCSSCLHTLLVPNHRVRTLSSGLEVHSFYAYDEIKKLLHTKHTYQGQKIFFQLGKHAFSDFLKTLTCKDIVTIPIDDHVRSGYSHSGVLARSIKKQIKPLYRALRAKNPFRYSGQKRAKRESQRRDFTLRLRKHTNVILIDDILTTGQTLQEAEEKLSKAGAQVLFALVLADAKREF